MVWKKNVELLLSNQKINCHKRNFRANYLLLDALVVQIFTVLHL